MTATASNLIGPLTTAEWCSLRLGTDDDPLQCCGNTSDVRTAVFDTLRMGAEPHDDVHLRAVWHIVDEHPGMAEHPVMRKLYEYYVEGKEPLPPESALADLLAVDLSYASALIRAAAEAFDLTTYAGQVTALGRIAPKVAYVRDPAERGTATAELAAVCGMPADEVARVVDTWRANVGLPL